MTGRRSRKGSCYDCGASTAAVRCHECTLLFQSMRRMAANCKRRKEQITRRELRALATCEDSVQSQQIVDGIIERGAANIQSGWSEAERAKRRGGGAPQRWTPPVCAEPPEWNL